MTISTTSSSGQRFATSILKFDSSTEKVSNTLKIQIKQKRQQILGFGGAITDGKQQRKQEWAKTRRTCKTIIWNTNIS